MPTQSATSHENPDFKAIARRWLALAERRLASYNELYRSGRWTHYYATQEEFAGRMLDVIKAAKAYQEIAGEPALAAPRAEPLRPAA